MKRKFPILIMKKNTLYIEDKKIHFLIVNIGCTTYSPAFSWDETVQHQNCTPAFSRVFLNIHFKSFLNQVISIIVFWWWWKNKIIQKRLDKSIFVYVPVDHLKQQMMNITLYKKNLNQYFKIFKEREMKCS